MGSSGGAGEGHLENRKNQREVYGKSMGNPANGGKLMEKLEKQGFDVVDDDFLQIVNQLIERMSC